jgi:uncharacterized protein YdeI (BOF family)
MPRRNRILHQIAILLFVLLSPAALASLANNPVSDTETSEAKPLFQQKQRHFKLEAHTAKYTARFKKGVNIKGSGVRQLKALGNDRWLYRFDVDSLPVDIRESVQFVWQDNSVRPIEYQYSRDGFFIRKKTRSILFDDQDNLAEGKNSGDSWKIKIPSNSLDRLSYQVQLLVDIALERSPMQYQVVHKGRLEDSQFQIIREETLQTKIGTEQSVVVEKVRSPEKQRKTLLWFSKSNPLILLRMYQQEKDGEEYEITIQSIEK